jgi:hypothetical protein
VIVFYTRQHERIEVPGAMAVAATTLPHIPVIGQTPPVALAAINAAGETIAVFRVSQLVGYDTTGTNTVTIADA